MYHRKCQHPEHAAPTFFAIRGSNYCSRCTPREMLPLRYTGSSQKKCTVRGCRAIALETVCAAHVGTCAICGSGTEERYGLRTCSRGVTSPYGQHTPYNIYEAGGLRYEMNCRADTHEIFRVCDCAYAGPYAHIGNTVHAHPSTLPIPAKLRAKLIAEPRCLRWLQLNPCMPPVECSLDCEGRAEGTMCKQCARLNTCGCGLRVSTTTDCVNLRSCGDCLRTCAFCRKATSREATGPFARCNDCADVPDSFCYRCGVTGKRSSKQFPMSMDQCLEHCNWFPSNVEKTMYQYLAIENSIATVQPLIDSVARIWKLGSYDAACTVICTNADFANVEYTPALNDRARDPFGQFRIRKHGTAELAYYFAATLLPRDIFRRILAMIFGGCGEYMQVWSRGGDHQVR